MINLRKLVNYMPSVKDSRFVFGRFVGIELKKLRKSFGRLFGDYVRLISERPYLSGDKIRDKRDRESDQ